MNVESVGHWQAVFPRFNLSMVSMSRWYWQITEVGRIGQRQALSFD
ncbi:MAG: hypothetical protein OJF50_004420 [Nitrospira sp.]|nr:hypothetical protein [Nitrospira sp.]